MAQTRVATPFFDIAEAAAYLKVSKATIYSWIHQRKKGFPVRYHGRRVVFLADALKQWSDAQAKRGVI
jgi:excisionase family DNA binding protein